MTPKPPWSAKSRQFRRIRAASGLPPLAHPVRLRERGPELYALVASLIDEGLQGIEVSHSEHSKADCTGFADVARTFNLVQAGGTDYRGTAKPDVELGYGIGRNVWLGYDFLERTREQACCSAGGRS